MSLSCKIFKSQFVYDRHEIKKEAPFQHHFAQIIRTVGDLYSIGKTDLFKVELEKREDDLFDKRKYFDITCGFEGQIKCVIELKFKLKMQGAQEFARIDSYVDL